MGFHDSSDDFERVLAIFARDFAFNPPILPDVFLVKWGILFLKKADAVRDLLSRINPEEILRMYEETVDTMKRNRVFREGTIEGYVIAVIDGMKLFSSTKKKCPECLIRKKPVRTDRMISPGHGMHDDRKGSGM